ncbi:MAG: peptide chain release factor N(5)-glutamine methyltransferase [Coriobacteriia bacterium]|nr:peptide chain release factor N(5)-glutamine methyltransferase [Coriobacteriia bacterium]
MTKQWAILEALTWTEQRLAREGEENPRLAAQMLAAHATGLTRIELYAHFDKPLSDDERTILRESIQRRLEGEPLQYIIGRTGFRHLELEVRPPVLIPRPETELLVDLVIKQVAATTDPCTCLEIGTGTGAIALSLLHELPTCQVSATDIDDAAIVLAGLNARELDLDSCGRFKLSKDDLASSFIANDDHHGYFDVVVPTHPTSPLLNTSSSPRRYSATKAD